MLKRRFKCVLISLFFFISLQARTAVFFSPHPDDEVLSMGCGILKDLRDGNDVYVVIMTHGEASGAIYVINGTGSNGQRQFCQWHQKYHDPRAEGYAVLSKTAFGESRLREMAECLEKLGVNKRHFIIYNFFDGNLVKDSVKAIMLNFESAHPKSLFRTTSFFDNHPDHSACGRALKELGDSGKISNSEFFISPAQWDQSIIPAEYERNPAFDSIIRSALAAYTKWEPAKGFFAIGHHSVPTLFENDGSAPKSKHHDAQAIMKTGWLIDLKIKIKHFLNKSRWSS